jgi:putative methionine-R-sulfoxide reductase with GAF domain
METIPEIIQHGLIMQQNYTRDYATWLNKAAKLLMPYVHRMNSLGFYYVNMSHLKVKLHPGFVHQP